MFGRTDEWRRLVEFTTSTRPGTRLAVLAGRRRQGKTVLLQSLVDKFSGFYWQARQQSSAQNRASFGEALGRFLGTPAPLRFVDWEAAVEALIGAIAAREQGTVAVIDEFGYLLSAEPAVASHLQAALSPGGAARRLGRARLILCGSSFGQMRRLLDADAPLRGRADLELTLRPFDYREASRFWGLRSNPDAAFRLHALVGGTPAYRDYSTDLPDDGDVDRWAIANLFDTGSPLFREGRVVVAEDPALVDQSLYWGVLGAIAEGASQRNEIADALGRAATSLAHAISTVVEAGWVVADRDPLRDRGATYRLDEPMVRFHRLVIEPNEARLMVRRDPGGVWTDALPAIRSQIYAGHLEHLAREWFLAHATEETTGGVVTTVGPSVLTTGQRRQRLRLDLVATSMTSRGATSLLAIGEVKSGSTAVGSEDLARLDSATTMLHDTAGKIRSASPVKRILVARAGFTSELTRAARRRPDVELVDLHRLYAGN